MFRFCYSFKILALRTFQLLVFAFHSKNPTVSQSLDSRCKVPSCARHILVVRGRDIRGEKYGSVSELVCIAIYIFTNQKLCQGGYIDVPNNFLSRKKKMKIDVL